MKVTNIAVFGLAESILASSYPFQTEIIPDLLENAFPSEELYDKQEPVATKLAQCVAGSGHDNFLNGCLVQFDVVAPAYWWQQAQRYHFLDFISSQSKMHSITKFDMDKQCNECVDKEIISIAKSYVRIYKEGKIDKRTLLSNIPMGFEIGARMTTNYRQLKTIYLQRRDHVLPEWKQFCKFIEELPKAKELICKTIKLK